MKKIIAILVVLLLPVLSLAQFREYNTIGIATDNSKEPIAVFFNTYTGECNPQSLCADSEWVDVDVSDVIPEDAGAIFLSGLLIITHGITNETCHMTISFRAPSSDFEESQYGSYLGQVVEAHIGGGQRSGFSSWVPIEHGIFQMKWARNTYSQWPHSCAYGINLTLQAYVRNRQNSSAKKR